MYEYSNIDFDQEYATEERLPNFGEKELVANR